MYRALTIIIILIGVLGCAGGSATLIESSDDLKSFNKGPRWGIVEVRTDIQYETQKKAADKKMENYCAPQRYKIVETNVAYKQVPKWTWTGTHMISTGDQTQRWEYIKFICVDSD